MAETIGTIVAEIKQEGGKLVISQINDVGDAGEKTEKRLKKQNKRSESSFKQLAVQAAKMIAVYVGIKEAIGFWTDSIKIAKDFSSSISDLSAITGATGETLEYLKDQSLEFGRVTTLTASQAATAFKLVASAKPDLLDNAEALAQVTKEAITLAEASGTDLPAAAITLGSALNQFGASADEAGRFINVLAAGAKFGASEIATTAEALKDSGTIAAAAGISFEELNANIQALASVSIKGARAGVGLRNVILKLQNQSDKGLNPAIVGLNKAMENLGKKQLGVTELTKLFGLESVVVAQTLIEQAGSLQDLTDKLTDTNTAYEQARVKVDNLDGDVKKLNSTFEALQIRIGSANDEDFRVLVQTLTQVVSSFSDTNLIVGESAGTFNTIASSINTVSTFTQKLAIEFFDLGNYIGYFAAASIDLFTNFGRGIEDMQDARQKHRNAVNEEITALEARDKVINASIETNRALLQASDELKVFADIDGIQQTFVFATKEAAEEARKELQEIKELTEEIIQAPEKTKKVKETETGISKDDAQKATLKLERLETSLLEEEDREYQSYQRRLQMLWDNAEASGKTEEEINAIEESLLEKHQKNLTKIHKKGLTERQKFQAMTLRSQTQNVFGEIASITQGVAQHNEKMFKINKAAAIVNAVMNAHAGASRSLKEYPWPLAGVMAGLHYWAGFERVKAIKATQFQSAGAGSAPTSVGGGTGAGTVGELPSNNFAQDTQERKAEGRSLTLIFQGAVYGMDDFNTRVLDAFRDNINEYDEIIIQNDSAQAGEIRRIA
jgi:TP901 family phage tail tape measure protein